MASASANELRPGSSEWNSVQGFLSRERLARLVVVGSFLTLFLMVGAIFYFSGSGTSPGAGEVADKVFNTILPVLAGWVGTVLAYFFSAQNLERTSATLDKAMDAVGQSSGGQPAQPSDPVYDKMIKVENIKKLQDLTGKALGDIKLLELQKAFQGAEPDPPASRLVFLDGRKFRYLMHFSVLNAYLVGHVVNASGQPTNVAELTLQNLVDDPESLRQISKLVAFVSGSANLADAKAAIDAIPGAQDIIVTKTGDAAGDVIGWISNVDLVKLLN